MTRHDLARLLCAAEKGKKQVDIAQMKEIVKNLCNLIQSGPAGTDILHVLTKPTKQK